MDALLKVFSEAGIQWMGWAIALVQFAWYQRKDSATTKLLVDVSEKSTKAITELTVLFSERMPKGGA